MDPNVRRHQLLFHHLPRPVPGARAEVSKKSSPPLGFLTGVNVQPSSCAYFRMRAWTVLCSVGPGMSLVGLFHFSDDVLQQGGPNVQC